MTLAMPEARPHLLSEYENYLRSPEGIFAYRRFIRWLYRAIDTPVALFDAYVAPEVANQRRETIRLLDLGAGDGRRSVAFSGSLARKSASFVSLTLVDQSPSLLQQALKRRLPPRITCTGHCGRIHSLNTAQSHDVIVACHSLFTTPPIAFARVLSRTLAEGGVLAIASNAPDSFLGRLKRWVDKTLWLDQQRYEITHHLTLLTPMFHHHKTYEGTTSWTVARKDLIRFQSDLLRWLSLGRQHLLSKAERREFSNLAREGTQALPSGGIRYFEGEVLHVFQGPVDAGN